MYSINIKTPEVSNNYSYEMRAGNQLGSIVTSSFNSNYNIKNDVNIGTTDIYKEYNYGVINNDVYTEKLDKVLEDLNRIMFNFNRKFDYKVHEQTNKIIVKILDTDTNEVIKELPPENRLDAIAKLWDMAGINLDDII